MKSFGISAAGGSEALEWSAGVSRLRTDGMYEFNNEYGNTVLSGRVGVRPDRVTGIALTARYSDARAAFPTDFTGAPGGSEPHEHEGVEFVYVLSGRLVIEMDSRTELLEEGDAAYFDSAVPHSYRREGDGRTTAIVVVAR